MSKSFFTPEKVIVFWERESRSTNFLGILKSSINLILLLLLILEVEKEPPLFLNFKTVHYHQKQRIVFFLYLSMCRVVVQAPTHAPTKKKSSDLIIILNLDFGLCSISKYQMKAQNPLVITKLIDDTSA